MTTGAGGMVIIGDVAAALPTKHANNTVKSLWSKIATGFTSHRFKDGGTTLTTEFWDIKQNRSVYSFDVKLQ
jgi:hypothetical protein